MLPHPRISLLIRVFGGLLVGTQLYGEAQPIPQWTALSKGARRGSHHEMSRRSGFFQQVLRHHGPAPAPPPALTHGLPYACTQATVAYLTAQYWTGSLGSGSLGCWIAAPPSEFAPSCGPVLTPYATVECTRTAPNITSGLPHPSCAGGGGCSGRMEHYGGRVEEGNGTGCGDRVEEGEGGGCGGRVVEGMGGLWCQMQ